LWGEHITQGTGLSCVFIAAILGILEVSLSFDNAVVNAAKLEKMTPIWQKRFITWGIAIAVFGMRLLFPLLIVSIFAGIDFSAVLPMALNEPAEYAKYLHKSHSAVVSFGGAFLLMLFLNFITSKREYLWIKPIEKHFEKLADIKYFDIFITMLTICFALSLNPVEKTSEILIPAIVGATIFSLINKLANYIENKENTDVSGTTVAVAKGGFISFLYLELIDASFSLDGVLGAFALSSDIIIISIGLCIGAIFVRSLTIMLVQKKTLKKFVYLESGAHWAIAVLAIIMFISTAIEIPEIITALSGLAFILASIYSSVQFSKKESI
jgi:hypothetical protein